MKTASFVRSAKVRGTSTALCALAVAALLAALPAGARAAGPSWDARRAAMVETVSVLARSIGSESGSARIDAAVIAALSTVPRHEFVPEAVRASAYDNRPLPIGHGQTISQPYIVALMTDLLAVKPGARVLEIGTGSGYQAAILAELGAQVHTIEIIEPLARSAAERLARAGYVRVLTRTGDGYYGWPEAAPFDAIVVTAAAGHVPPALIEQLGPGGRLVIPVGAPFLAQHLVLLEKAPDGSVSSRQLLPVRFVPLTGGH